MFDQLKTCYCNRDMSSYLVARLARAHAFAGVLPKLIVFEEVPLYRIDAISYC